MAISVSQANYKDMAHKQAIERLMSHYAQSDMGGRQDLAPEVKSNLVAALDKFPGAFSLLAWEGEQAIGLANCFLGFSTFKCKPLVNIHDFVVVNTHRGRGIAQQLMSAIEAKATKLGCCKLTLEVLAQNEPAKRAYAKFGFEGYQLTDHAGQALFWQKAIPLHS